MKFISLFIFICIICISNSQTLQQLEYDCANSLINKLVPNNQDKLLYFNYNGTMYDYCNSIQPNVLSFGCLNQNFVYSILINLPPSNSTVMTSQDFICFSYSYIYTLNNLTFEDNFLRDGFRHNITSLRFSSKNSPTLLNFDNETSLVNMADFSISCDYSNINKTFSLFNNFVNVSSIYISLDSYNDNTTIEFINDIESYPTRKSKTTSFTSQVSSLPNFEGLGTITLCQITLLPNFKAESYSTFSYYSNIKNLYIYDLYQQPISFPSFPNNSSFTNLLIQNRFLKPKDFISFPSTPNLTKISFLNVGPEFNIDGKIPFKFIPIGLASFSFSNGNLTEIPSYDSFNKTADSFSLNLSGNSIGGTLPIYNNSKLKNLNLASNNLIGTLDKSYCMLENLIIYNNQLSGELPSCFTCHFSSTRNFYLAYANNFSNVNQIPKCTSIILNFENIGQGNYSFYGIDIGFTTDDFYIFVNNQSVKILNSNSIVPNYNIQFNITQADIKVITVVYKYSNPVNLTFDVVVNNAINPLVSGYTNNNDGSFVIQGSYFSNNISALSVEIGQYQCDVQSSTFNTINCKINNYDTLSRNLTVSIKMANSLSNQIVIDPVSTNEIYASSINVDVYNNATIRGWFGDNNIDLSVYLGDKNCSVYFVNTTTIVCQVDIGGTGIVPLNISQNSFNWIGKGYYLYPSNDISCLNNCTDSNHGICISTSGICQCKEGFTGLDCGSKNSVVELPKSNVTININQNSSTISINNQQTNFEIGIVKLIESDLNGKIVREFPLKSNWMVSDTNIDNENQDLLTWVFNQTLFNETSIIYTVEKAIKDTPMSFANVPFTLEKDSIKTKIDINNYIYQSVLNSLQLIFETSVNELNIQDKNNCNNQTTDINSDNPYFIIIKKDGKSFYSRIIDRLLSDNRSTFMNTEIINQSNTSLTISMNLPHCTNCSIDPQFSVLLSSDFINSCSSNKKQWLIPVAVVVPVVAVAILIGSIIYLRKRKEMKLFESKLKSISSKNN